MGWKNIKNHYRIVHIVAVHEGKGICIGSPYVHDLLTITSDGTVKWGNLGPSRNDDLARYHAEMTADPAKLVELMNSADTFSKSTTVYTYEGGEIIEKRCEKPGWPNVTHDGLLMYDNSFSTDKKKVVALAKGNAAAGIELAQDRVKELQADLRKAEGWLEEHTAALAKLNADYPEPSLRKDA